MIPFSVEQFLDVFGRYNTDLPYIGFAASVAALLSAAAAFTNDRRFRPFTVLVLVFLWAWAGIVYQIGYFAEINTLAYLFGSIFVLQAFLLLYFGLLHGDLQFAFNADVSDFIGVGFILYSIVLYPMLGNLFGHNYPRTPTFGVPCPITIFTFGLLIWNKKPVTLRLLAIPLLWTIIGSTATFLFGIWEDAPMLVAAGATIFLNAKKRRKKAGLNMIAD